MVPPKKAMVTGTLEIPNFAPHGVSLSPRLSLFLPAPPEYHTYHGRKDHSSAINIPMCPRYDNGLFSIGYTGLAFTALVAPIIPFAPELSWATFLLLQFHSP